MGVPGQTVSKFALPLLNRRIVLLLNLASIKEKQTNKQNLCFYSNLFIFFLRILDIFMTFSLRSLSLEEWKWSSKCYLGACQKFRISDSTPDLLIETLRFNTS